MSLVLLFLVAKLPFTIHMTIVVFVDLHGVCVMIIGEICFLIIGALVSIRYERKHSIGRKDSCPVTKCLFVIGLVLLNDNCPILCQYTHIGYRGQITGDDERTIWFHVGYLPRRTDTSSSFSK